MSHEPPAHRQECFAGHGDIVYVSTGRFKFRKGHLRVDLPHSHAFEVSLYGESE